MFYQSGMRYRIGAVIVVAVMTASAKAQQEPHVINQVYEKMIELFGDNERQLFLMEFPGRILSEELYVYEIDSPYSLLEKPVIVEELEFRLSDDLYDVGQICNGPNGQKLSLNYELAINTLLPSYANRAQIEASQAEVRDWLLEPVEIDLGNGTENLSRIAVYKRLNKVYLEAKAEWDHDRVTELEERVGGAQTGDERHEAMEGFARWLARTAPTREAGVENFFADLLIRGEYHKVRSALAYLDASTEAELLEMAKSRLRITGRSSLDESQVVYPVQLQPADWFLALSSDFTPVDLLMDPVVIQQRLVRKKQDLVHLETRRTLLKAQKTGSVDVLQGQVNEMLDKRDQAKAAMIENFSDVVITAAETYFEKKRQQKEEPVEQEFEDAVRAIAGDESSAIDFNAEDFQKLRDFQNKTIEAQINLSKSIRQLSDLRSRTVAAEASDTTQAVILLDGQIDSLQQEIQDLEQSLATVVRQTGGEALNLTEPDAEGDGANQAGAQASQVEVSMLPSRKPGVGQFMDVIMEFSAGETSSSESLSRSSSETSWDVDLLFGSASGSSSESSSDFSSAFSTSNTEFKMGFRAMKVRIDRGGWFQPQIFAETSDMFKLDDGVVISQGFPESTPVTNTEFQRLNNALLPAFPIAFVVAKDITIMISRSAQSDAEWAKARDASDDVSGGVFCFSASHASSSHDNSQGSYSSSSDSHIVIRIPHPQIIGWFLQYTDEDVSRPLSDMKPEDFPR